MIEKSKNSFVKDKIKLLLKIVLVLSTVIGTMTIIRILEKDYIQALADLFIFIALIVGYFILKRDYSQYNIVIRIVLVLSAGGAIFVLMHQPENPIRFIWISTVIYLVFYLFERRESFYWISIIMVLLSLLFLLEFKGLHISLVNFMVWLMNMLVVLMIALWYSKVEEESTKKLLEAKRLLSDEVKNKTIELEEKTRELQSLNQNLEARIQEKIKKSREQEEMLFRQARYAQMGEMISMIAHQWRQPLNAISAATATMQLKIDMDRYEKDAFREKTVAISEYIQHLSATIDDFRNFFKPKKEKEKVGFSDTVEDALKLARSALENRNITVVNEYLCGNCIIYIYRNELVHVILNLIKNAEDAFQEKNITDPKIIIRTFRQEKSIYVEVEDNAGGIEPSVIDEIFDPYFTTKKNSDGTGLGLYMSKIIIEDHCHGKIEVSNGEEGAIFKLRLPL